MNSNKEDVAMFTEDIKRISKEEVEVLIKAFAGTPIVTYSPWRVTEACHNIGVRGFAETAFTVYELSLEKVS